MTRLVACTFNDVRAATDLLSERTLRESTERTLRDSTQVPKAFCAASRTCSDASLCANF
jgi:hypothetical protein